MLRKHTAATDLESAVYQFKNYALAFLADRRQVLHLDHEIAAKKVRLCLFARIPQLVCPGCNKPAFHNHSTLSGTLDERDLQHLVLPTLVIRQREDQTLRHRKSLNFQEATGQPSRWQG